MVLPKFLKGFLGKYRQLSLLSAFQGITILIVYTEKQIYKWQGKLDFYQQHAGFSRRVSSKQHPFQTPLKKHDSFFDLIIGAQLLELSSFDQNSCSPFGEIVHLLCFHFLIRKKKSIIIILTSYNVGIIYFIFIVFFHYHITSLYPPPPCNHHTVVHIHTF